MHSYTEYNSGHPWYYYLGGAVLYPKQIIEDVKATGYCGYLVEEIESLDQCDEPQRSEGLRKLRIKIVEEINSDLSRYRALARELHEYCKTQPPIQEGVSVAHDIHTNISLKHNHLFNGFAHLITIDDFLAIQPDLFG